MRNQFISTLFILFGLITLYTIPYSEENKSTINNLAALNDSCKCFDGIGSSKDNKPNLVFTFSNGESVSVCGYQVSDDTCKELIMSEFMVFDCKSGDYYLAYGATKTCRIIEKQDTLVVQLLIQLPKPDDWKWSSTQIAEQYVYLDNNQIVASKRVFHYSPIAVEKSEMQVFFTKLKNREIPDSDWENTVGKLTLFALNGNKEAMSIIQNYESVTGHTPTGILSEYLTETIDIIKWAYGI